jgi:spore cortex formation protein SpoVR/YcgB (stage V sporulation)
LTHIRRLWGYDVSLVGVDANSGKVIYETMTDDLSDD